MRIDFPESWKIVLVQPKSDANGFVYGDEEKLAFQQLPAATQGQADGLVKILKERMVPGILRRDFSQFANAVTEYGRESGSYYSRAQGGSYASPSASALVQKISSLGDYGIGQSSWGPTLFAIGPSEKSANWLVEKLLQGEEDVACHATIVSADNDGMTIH
jgi:predicted sugar kinase